MSGPVIPDPTPAWLKPENASVTDSALTKAMRMIGHLIGADNPTAQVFNLMMTDIPGGSATGGLAKAVEGLKERVIKAYHGSPHDFERFSLEKIGTGEGAQAYGHGLYFAENPTVAEEYRRQLAHPPETLVSYERDVAAMRARANADPALEPYARQAEQNLERMRAMPGKTYEVAIKADPEDFLDWDKPLSQQSEKVKNTLKSLLYKDVQAVPAGNGMSDIKIGKATLGTVPNERVQSEALDSIAASLDPRTGDMVPREVAQTSANASARLKSAGLPGIKYLDQGSRAAGEGSRNYVVFDDQLIDILKKYGLVLPATGLAGNEANR